MTNHPDEADLNEFVDGTLVPDDRLRVERHLASCVACTGAVRRIEAIVLRARALPREIAPPADAWAEVRRAARSVEHRQARPVLSGATWRRAAAAAVLVGLSALGTLWLTGRDAGPPRNSSGTEGTTPVPADGFAPLEARYVLAVSGLRRALDERRDQLDPSTVATVERSLATIDAAIAEASEALAADPANATLTRLLAASYEQKVDLLRRANELPPRS